MIEIKKVWNRTNQPILTYIIAATCLLVTFSIYFFPNLNSILNAEYNIQYPWQRFVAIFAHGAGNTPIFIHLFGNLTGLLVFGCLAEKLIGKVRYAALCALCIIVFLLHFTITNGNGNGVSVIAWGVLPFGGYIIVHNANPNIKTLLSSSHIIMIILLVWAWFVFPLVIGPNRYHETSTFIGCVFLFLFRQNISQKYRDIIEGKNVEESKIVRYCLASIFLLIPVFVIFLIVLHYAGILA